MWSKRKNKSHPANQGKPALVHSEAGTSPTLSPVNQMTEISSQRRLSNAQIQNLAFARQQLGAQDASGLSPRSANEHKPLPTAAVEEQTNQTQQIPQNSEPEPQPSPVMERSKVQKLTDQIQQDGLAVDFNDISISEQIAEGQFSNIYYGEYQGAPVAIKIFKEDLLDVENLVKQFQILNSVRSPSIVYFYGITLEPKVYIVGILRTRNSYRRFR